MSWFSKSDNAEAQMINSLLSGAPVAAESQLKRSEAQGASHPTKARVSEPAPRTSLLGRTVRFRGELSAQEDLIIQGGVEGSITHTQSLTIGADGTMKGDIRARVIVVEGQVEGDLYATESVSILAAARVKGNVFAPRICVLDGAFIQGQIEMQPSAPVVQEHSARLRQAAMSAPTRNAATADQMLTGS